MAIYNRSIFFEKILVESNKFSKIQRFQNLAEKRKYQKLDYIKKQNYESNRNRKICKYFSRLFRWKHLEEIS